MASNYLRLLADAGFALPPPIVAPFGQGAAACPSDTLPFAEQEKGLTYWIGVAPFAKHQGKIYPQTQMLRVLELLSQRPHTRLFLFGGGRQEREAMMHWQVKLPAIDIVSEGYSLLQEVGFMARLDLMISMDSANMHFASLTGIPVLSVWGQTHPDAGFYPWNQSPDQAVQATLPCRPCSIFGNKGCRRNDWACLYEIAPEQIVSKVETILKADAVIAAPNETKLSDQLEV